ncbi:hypothetical protein ATANTOWER_002184 [Ataeniobius toweri]|uniref:Uncharacterized protein n=1 Tax=Ataeniobius toweri TaxID=208326 RepID=A0ABU7ANY1_9TELE|nr:hypothetical protein [Ataeniobius toweri]
MCLHFCILNRCSVQLNYPEPSVSPGVFVVCLGCPGFCVNRFGWNRDGCPTCSSSMVPSSLPCITECVPQKGKPVISYVSLFFLFSLLLSVEPRTSQQPL